MKAILSMKTVKDEIPTNPLGQLDHVEQLLGDCGSHTPQQNQIATQLAAIQELVATVSGSSTLDIGCKQLADLLAEHLGGSVYVGICQNPSKSCQLVAASEFQHVDSNHTTVQLASYAMEETLARAKPSHWPNQNPRESYSLQALRQFAESHSIEEKHRNLFILPLQNDDCVSHGVLLYRSSKELSHDDLEVHVRFLQAAAPLLASAIGLHIRAAGNQFDRIAKQWSEYFGIQKLKLALLALTIAISAMFIPISYNVHCKCELQPVVRRFVSAPFAGQLEKSFVEPGDTVSKGEVLARLDARDVNWDLSGKLAEWNRAISVRDGHLAAHRSGEARIATLEVERLKLAVDQLKYRAKKLEIQSPISGIIVVGDLTKSEGVMLDTGKMLYEIAPLDQMVVEVAIPENDVRFVKSGMTVNIILDAFPNKSIEAKIRRVHPRAELKENDNVFIAELEIPNKEKSMRPGMRGFAKITTGKKPIGWILLHKAYESLRTVFF